jgi:hypothetical protein
MSTRLLPILLVAAALGGCAAAVKKGPADTVAALRVPPRSANLLVLTVAGSGRSASAADWEGFKQEWREAFAEQTRAAGMAFRMEEGQITAGRDDGVLVSVFVDDYRFIRPGTRFGLGIMTGNAYIESKIRFSDLKSGATFGEQTYNTSSSAWEGVFSAMTNKQVEAIARDAVRQVKGR